MLLSGKAFGRFPKIQNQGQRKKKMKEDKDVAI